MAILIFSVLIDILGSDWFYLCSRHVLLRKKYQLDLPIILFTRYGYSITSIFDSHFEIPKWRSYGHLRKCKHSFSYSWCHRLSKNVLHKIWTKNNKVHSEPDYIKNTIVYIYNDLHGFPCDLDLWSKLPISFKSRPKLLQVTSQVYIKSKRSSLKSSLKSQNCRIELRLESQVSSLQLWGGVPSFYHQNIST